MSFFRPNKAEEYKAGDTTSRRDERDAAHADLGRAEAALAGHMKSHSKTNPNERATCAVCSDLQIVVDNARAVYESLK